MKRAQHEIFNNLEMGMTLKGGGRVEIMNLLGEYSQNVSLTIDN